MTDKIRRLTLVSTAVLALGAMAGCGSSDNSSSGTTTTAAAGGTDAMIAEKVPDNVKTNGLTVALDATYAPNEFIDTDGKTVIGMDADLAKAIGGLMGVKVKLVNSSFDSIIPGLAAGKYNLGMSSFTDTKEREQTVDFVTYFTAGTSFYTKVDGGPDIQTVADLCGKKLAVQKATTQQDDATAQSKKCKTAGKPAVNIQSFTGQDGANLALASGRAEVVMADSPVAAYAVKQSKDQFKLTGQPYGTAPYGIAIPKNSGLAEPVLAAVKALMENGQYKTILTKWGVEGGAITDPVINGATS